MRLNSQGNQYIFNLPSNFLTQDIINDYSPILEKNFVQYSNILDYLNSTIKSVTFPGLSIQTPMQHKIRGKEIDYKPATNAQDILTPREINVTFRSVDADLNYMLLFDIFLKHYLDVDNLYLMPFTLTLLDIYRDAIYSIEYTQLIAISLSDNLFDYSQQKVNAKDFTMTFKFNFININFLLNKSKILQPGNSSFAPQIINTGK